jgi:hypothetical protein
MTGGITVLVGLLLLLLFIYLALIPAWGGGRLGGETWQLLKGCFYLALMGSGIMAVIFGVFEWKENRKARKSDAAVSPPVAAAPESPRVSEPPPAEGSTVPDSAETAVPEEASPPSEETG